MAPVLEQVEERDVEIGVHARDWKDAIVASSRYLLETGKIEPRYVDAMIDTVERMGPYLVLTDHVALAHARPECGACELAVHFTTLDEGVDFGSPQFDPIRLVITLSAVDDVSHLELMAELATVLMDPVQVDALIASVSSREFVDLLARFTAEGLAA